MYLSMSVLLKTELTIGIIIKAVSIKALHSLRIYM